MSVIAVRMTDGAPSAIALAGFSGQLANRNVDTAEIPKHTLRIFFSLRSVLLFWRKLVYQLGPLAFDHRAHLIRDVVDVLDIEQVVVEAL
jgi:hypothetical protein